MTTTHTRSAVEAQSAARTQIDTGTPWKVIESFGKRTPGPTIVDCNGKPVMSFGNQSHWRGAAWAWTVARLIVRSVNEATR